MRIVKFFFIACFLLSVTAFAETVRDETLYLLPENLKLDKKSKTLSLNVHESTDKYSLKGSKEVKVTLIFYNGSVKEVILNKKEKFCSKPYVICGVDEASSSGCGFRYSGQFSDSLKGFAVGLIGHQKVSKLKKFNSEKETTEKGTFSFFKRKGYINRKVPKKLDKIDCTSSTQNDAMILVCEAKEYEAKELGLKYSFIYFFFGGTKDSHVGLIVDGVPPQKLLSFSTEKMSFLLVKLFEVDPEDERSGILKTSLLGLKIGDRKAKTLRKLPQKEFCF